MNTEKNSVLCSWLHLWLPHTHIQHYFQSDHMILSVDMTVPHGQDQEHRLQHSHTTYCIQMWVIHLIAYIACWHMGHYINILTGHLYFSSTVTVLLIGTTFLSPHLITTTSLGQTHLLDTKMNHCKASHCSGHNDLNEVIRLHVTVTGHSQVTVTLTWANNLTHKGFLTQTWHPLSQ